MGIVKGFPILLGIKKSVCTSGKAFLRLKVGWSAGSLPNVEKEGYGAFKAGLTMEIKIIVLGLSYALTKRSAYPENQVSGARDLFNTPWEEMVKDDSNWFTPQGEMKVRLKVSIKSG